MHILELKIDNNGTWPGTCGRVPASRGRGPENRDAAFVCALGLAASTTATGIVLAQNVGTDAEKANVAATAEPLSAEG